MNESDPRSDVHYLGSSKNKAFESEPFVIAMTKGSLSKRQLLNSSRWPIYVINSVDNTKFIYPAILSHRRSTIVSLQNYPLYSFELQNVLQKAT